MDNGKVVEITPNGPCKVLVIPDRGNSAWVCQQCKCMMEPVSEDFCRCPECGTEVWYNYKQDEIKSLMSDMSKGHATTELLPAGQPAKGGGSNNGKKRKQPVKKDSTQMIYKKMFKQT